MAVNAERVEVALNGLCWLVNSREEELWKILPALRKWQISLAEASEVRGCLCLAGASEVRGCV